MKKSEVMFCLLLSITDNALGNIIIENSWVRAAAPGTKVMAAYMTIVNNSVKPIEMDIEKIISKGFKKTEVHKSSLNGMMTMEKIDTIIIKPNESLVLEPGGLHFMLINYSLNFNNYLQNIIISLLISYPIFFLFKIIDEIN